MNRKPIGVFDSGIGGISLLRNLRLELPAEDFIYYGDDANAPYGTRPEQEILSLVRNDVAFLCSFGVKAIVIACNTATSAAAKVLRSEMSIPIIGIEPALKPAEEMRGDGMIAVLATPATLRQEKFRELYSKYGSHAIPIPCPGLMEFAEREITDGKELDDYLKDILSPLKGIKLDGVVLGCTHYSFLCNSIRKALGNVRLFDGNAGTARQLRRVLADWDLLSDKSSGSIRLFTSGNSDINLPRMQRMLNLPIEIE